MRPIWLLAAAVVLSGAAFAQGRGITGTGAFGGFGGFTGTGLPYRTFGSPSGFGNILAPGVGTFPPLTNGPTFPQRLGATVGGFPYTGTSGRLGGRGRGAVAIPYAVPVWVGGYGYGYGYDPGAAYQQQPPVTVVAPQQPSAPPVIINQYFTSDTARPAMKEYAPGSLPEPDSSTKTYTAPSGPSFPDPNEQKATIWLIAFKDGSIYPAIGFWTEGDTLHYITKDGSHNRASLELIDREFSEQLNRERGLEFKLGAGK